MNLSQHIQQTAKMIAKNRLPHAIIVETENMADILSYVMNCAKIILKTENLDAHPDFFALYPSGKSDVIRIEAIRELISDIQKTPNMGDQKVFAIFGAHRLNKSASNALLKTLEEPPGNTTLFLTTPSKTFLLSTIVSRCASHQISENLEKMLPTELLPWIGELELFLEKLQVNPETVNVLELFLLSEKLSKTIKNIEENDNKNRILSKDFYEVLLKAITEKIWHLFHLKLPTYRVERLIKIVQKSSLMLAVNGSFILTIENILLKLFSILFPKNNFPYPDIDYIDAFLIKM